ncbi:hypothetical protein CPARA_2gp321 (nucleomorph) [Cryptomonas paramecium]|uniref:Uncharacterized protein n=1 Tax=Cryptomonas paramaecium TaxID=2898 RepID=F2HI33_9CRYP|nr:hypothetical protein CPARA_2gp321 [Cryptomonas paramecium]AEA38979.1 hypothetical protein CPARA_2gp321 [Cryptomonas paramecium]
MYCLQKKALNIFKFKKLTFKKIHTTLKYKKYMFFFLIAYMKQLVSFFKKKKKNKFFA